MARPPTPLLEPLALTERALEAGLDEADLFLGVELAQLVPEPDRQALVGLVAALRLAEREGSSRLPLDAQRLAPFAAALGLGPAARALADELGRGPQRLAPVVGGPDDHRPLLVEDGCLHAQRMLALEQRLATGLARLASRRAVSEVDRAVAAVLAKPPRLAGQPLRLSDEQTAAVRAAATRGLTSISGGPGTGKTSIVVSILRVLVRLGIEPASIALAAPTGKAADRMRAATEAALARIDDPAELDRDLMTSLPRPQTLHRLLGFSPRDDTFRHHEHDPLAASVVLVDESSMVDLALADRLVRAMAAGAQLVLVGDAHQLPSVDAGAVFRDLCAEGEGVAVTLRHSYRMDATDPRGRSVLEAARAVDAGDATTVLATAERPVGELRLEGFERSGPASLEPFLQLWWERFGAPLIEGAGEPLEARSGRLTEAAAERAAARFERMDRARLLAPTRARREGVLALNEALHGRACAARDRDPRRTFAFGEPLLVTRNDYERALFNGDQGLVLPVLGERGVRPSAVFRTRDGMVAFALDAVRSLTELAWAVTVHKSQGSEHDVVALVLPAEPLPLTTRELVYTALTRARHGALVVGSDAVLRAAIEHRAERFSGLGPRFRAARSAPR